MEISPSRADDLEGLQQLYHQLNPDIAGQFEQQVHHESETFLAKDRSGSPSGLALVSYLDYGLYPYGIIQEISVRSSREADEIRRGLVGSCVAWLVERGAVSVLATASDDTERVFFQTLGFQSSNSEMQKRLPIQAAKQFNA